MTTYNPLRGGGAFDLVDHHGERVTQATYLGKYALIFFGFTRCRVVCPRNLRRISVALEAIGELADRITPLYITVDPERDSPETMRSFLETDYPRFTGLTGSREQIESAKKAFRIYAKQIDDPSEEDGYTVPHTALTFLLDPSWQYLQHFAETGDENQLADALRRFVTPLAKAETNASAAQSSGD